MMKITADLGRSEDTMEEQKIQSIVISVPSPNQSCAIIANIIMNKLISSIYEDTGLNELEKSILIQHAHRSRGPIEKYLTSISNKEAQELIDQIKYYLD